jgi:hypothetical protein
MLFVRNQVSNGWKYMLQYNKMKYAGVSAPLVAIVNYVYVPMAWVLIAKVLRLCPF